MGEIDDIMRNSSVVIQSTECKHYWEFKYAEYYPDYHEWLRCANCGAELKA